MLSESHYSLGARTSGVGESLESFYLVIQILFLLTVPIKCHADNILSCFKTKFESPSNIDKIVNKQL